MGHLKVRPLVFTLLTRRVETLPALIEMEVIKRRMREIEESLREGQEMKVRLTQLEERVRVGEELNAKKTEIIRNQEDII